MASEVDICNRALQLVGGELISSLSPATGKNAKTLALCYPIIRDAELEAHTWKFARKRASLATATDPAFGWDNQFDQPSDFLRLLSIGDDLWQPERWEIEGNKILTNEPAPLLIRYVARITDTTLFSPLFVEALAAKIAENICEEVTQSNTKKAEAKDAYKDAISRARRVNAIQLPPVEPRPSGWATAHLR